MQLIQIDKQTESSRDAPSTCDVGAGTMPFEREHLSSGNLSSNGPPSTGPGTRSMAFGVSPSPGGVAACGHGGGIDGSSSGIGYLAWRMEG